MFLFSIVRRCKQVAREAPTLVGPAEQKIGYTVLHALIDTSISRVVHGRLRFTFTIISRSHLRFHLPASQPATFLIVANKGKQAINLGE